MFSSYLVTFFTILILVVMGATFLFFSLKSLSHDVQRHWKVLLEQLNRRLDKVPHLLETLKNCTSGNDGLRKEIINLRAKSRPLEKADLEKVQSELILSGKLREVWALAEKSPDFQRNTDFLALKIEFKTLETNIEKYLENYNQKVRFYNKWIRFIFLKPFTLLFGFKRLFIFEFEGTVN